MTKLVEIPECARRLLGQIYPAMDLDRVRFYDGLPLYAFAKPSAITVGSNVHFREGKFDPCSCEGVALMAHELYHVHQGAGGFGFWFLRRFYLKYLWLWAKAGFRRGLKHPLEEPAYKLQEVVRQCCQRVQQSTGQPGPCVCENGSPVEVNQVFLDAFATECPQPLREIE